MKFKLEEWLNSRPKRYERGCAMSKPDRQNYAAHQKVIARENDVLRNALLRASECAEQLNITSDPLDWFNRFYKEANIEIRNRGKSE